MRDRLIELLKKADERCEKCKQCQECVAYGRGEDCINYLMTDHLLANGVIVPPVSVGQTVWFVRNEKIIETKVEKIVLKSKGLHLKLCCNAMYETSCNSIGKTVFLTKEEAEKALAERSKE